MNGDKKNANGGVDMEATDMVPNAIKDELPDGFYEVEAIRAKWVEKGEVKCLIKWRGWPESANTWEPIENLCAVSELVAAFEKREGLVDGPIDQLLAKDDGRNVDFGFDSGDTNTNSNVHKKVGKTTEDTDDGLNKVSVGSSKGPMKMDVSSAAVMVERSEGAAKEEFHLLRMARVERKRKVHELASGKKLKKSDGKRAKVGGSASIPMKVGVSLGHPTSRRSNRSSSTKNPSLWGKGHVPIEKVGDIFKHKEADFIHKDAEEGVNVTKKVVVNSGPGDKGIFDAHSQAGLLAITSLGQYVDDSGDLNQDVDKLVEQGQASVVQVYMKLNKALAYQKDLVKIGIAARAHVEKKLLLLEGEMAVMEEKVRLEYMSRLKNAESLAEQRKLILDAVEKEKGDVEVKCVSLIRERSDISGKYWALLVEKDGLANSLNTVKDEFKALENAMGEKMKALIASKDDLLKKLKDLEESFDERIIVAVEKVKEDYRSNYNQCYADGWCDSAQFLRAPADHKVWDKVHMFVPVLTCPVPDIEPLTPRAESDVLEVDLPLREGLGN